MKTKRANRLAQPSLVALPLAGDSEPIVIISDLMLIGRDAGCQVVLDSASVSQAHCLLVRLADRWVIRDLLSREGTLLNGEPISGASIGAGDELQIGRLRFCFDLDAERPATSKSPPALPAVTLKAPGSKSKLPLHSMVTLFGSQAGCEVDLRDPDIDAVHAAVVRTPGKVWLLDLASGSGVSVNDVGVEQQALQSGDRLQLGRFTFEVTVIPPAKSPDDEPPAELRHRRDRTTQLELFRTMREQLRLQQDADQPDEPPRSRTLLQAIAELERERQLLDQSAARVASQQSDLDRQRLQLDQRSAELEALAAGQVRPDGHEADLDAVSARLEQDRQRVRSERDRLAVQAEQLESQRLGLAAERDALAARVEELESQRQELAAQREQLALQQTELSKQRTQTQAERQAFQATREAGEKELADKREKLAVLEQESAAVRQNVESETQTLADLRAELEQTRQALAREQEDWQVAQHEQREQLQALQKELTDQRDHLDQQSLELEKQQHELQQRRQLAEDQLRQLPQQQAELKQLAENLQRRGEAVTALEAELEQQRELLDQRRGQWSEQERALADRQSALEARHAELQRQAEQLETRRSLIEQREAAVAETEADLLTQQAELAKVGSSIEGLQAELTEAQQQLAAQSQQLKEQEARLAAETKRLDEQRRQLDAQREEHAEKNRQAERELASQARQLETQREQIQRTERQLADRQAALTEREQAARSRDDQQESAEQRQELEAQRRQLEQERAELKREQEALDQARALVVADQDAVLRQQEAAARRAAAPVRIRPRWALALPVSLLLCLAAGWLTYQLWPQRYRATDTLTINTIAFPPAPVLHGHLAGVLDGEQIDLVARRLGADPDDLSITGRVDADNAAVQLTVQASSEWLASSVARQLLESYAEQVNEQAVFSTPTRQAELLEARRLELVESRREVLDQIEKLQAGESDSSPLERIARLDQAAEQLRQTQQQLPAEQTELESRLETLRADADAVRGTVDPTQCELTEQQDRELQQDLDHWRMHRRQFREELIAALQSALPRLEGIDQALRGLDDTIAEQRGTKPSADVAMVLDQVGAARDDLADAYRAFAGKWRESLLLVQDVTDRPDEQDLLGLQVEVESLLRDYLDQTQPMLTDLQEAVQTLSAPGDNAVQRTVAQNALSGRVSAFVAAQAEFASAGARVATTSNFRLDAAGKTIRGVWRRISDRRAQIAGELQVEADRLANETHQALVRQTEAELSAARQNERQALNDYWQVVERLDAARKDGELLQSQWHSLELSRLRLGQIEAQLVELDEQIRQLPDDTPQPDTADYSPGSVPETERLGASQAGLAAAIAAGAVFFTCCIGTALAGSRRRVA